MPRFLRYLALSASVLALLIGSTTTVFAASPNPVVGHVYVNNNSATHNSVAGFDRHANGSLTPIAGSPFPTGGAGTGVAIGSAGAIQFSADGRYVLAVDPASNDISVLRVKDDGSLRQVRTEASRGTTPVSLTVHGFLVYVANAGAGGSDYSGFWLIDGHLIPIWGSTFALPDTAAPGQILFSGDGRTLIATRVGPATGPSFIDSFRVGFFGRLTPASDSPIPAQRIGPFGSAFRPTNPRQLFVSNAHDGANLGSVSVYHVGRNASLTAIDGSPFADGQTAPCWVAITPDGKYLFAINTGNSTISQYRIAQGGGLTLLGSTPFNDPSGLRPFDAQVDPSGHYLYVVDAGAVAVSAFKISGGALKELGSSPFVIPGGAAPFGLIVN
ncbi:MAG: lactonase family protein [Candidatus Limnocylindrales bacterium]